LFCFFRIFYIEYIHDCIRLIESNSAARLAIILWIPFGAISFIVGLAADKKGSKLLKAHTWRWTASAVLVIVAAYQHFKYHLFILQGDAGAAPLSATAAPLSATAAPLSATAAPNTSRLVSSCLSRFSPNPWNGRYGTYMSPGLECR
jgi:hypothetical protein